MKTPLIIIALSITVLACKNISKSPSEKTPIKTEPKITLDIALNPKSGSKTTGNVHFEEKNGVVNMIAKVSGLSAGTHAIHIHQKSDCSSPDGKSTGGHWNPTAQPHGKWGDATGYHKGDIGNFLIDNEPITTVKFSTDQWCIGCGDPTKDILGKAVIIHQGTDDFVSQPSGAAGSRVSCAGIIQ